MKLRLTTFAAIVLLLTGFSGFAQDFDSVYPDTEFAVKFGPQLYYGAIRPVWTGPDTFVYTTNEPNGEAWYRMTGTRKEAIDKETYDDLRACIPAFLEKVGYKFHTINLGSYLNLVFE